MLPEPGESNRAGVLVGVLTLPVIKDQSRLAKGLKRVLGLRGRLGLFFLLSRSGLGGSLGLLLLLGRNVLDSLLNEDGLLNNGLEGGLVDNGLVPPGHSRVTGAPGLVQDSGKSTSKKSSTEEVCEGDTLANQVGIGSEMRLKDCGGLQSSLGGIIDSLLVVRVQAQKRAIPATEFGENFGIEERQPPQDGGIVLLGLA